MSELKRYTLCGDDVDAVPDDNGRWVKHEDYAASEQRVRDLELEAEGLPAKILAACGKFSDDPVTIEDALVCIKKTMADHEAWESQAQDKVTGLRETVKRLEEGLREVLDLKVHIPEDYGLNAVFEIQALTWAKNKGTIERARAALSAERSKG